MKISKKQSIRLLVSAAVLLFMSGAQAHHSSAPHFDSTKEVDVTGKFTQIKFVNPHAYLYFDVQQDGQSVPWRCELSSATQLKRYGWTKDMFAVGQEFTVKGTPARREDNVCFMKTMTLADGTEITRNGNLPTGAGDAVTDTAAAESVERPKVLANGQPNLQGPWVTLSFGRNAKAGIRARFEASDAGKAAVGDYDMSFDDPILKCHYVNLLNGWNHDENVNQIYQSDDSIKIQYGFMDVVRTVHLNMDTHPENITPSSVGHSIGSWDGEVLVVDTVGFEEGILSHRDGMKHSDQMHVVERFRFDEAEQRLYRDYRVTDPLYLVGETTGQDAMAMSDTPYVPYNCVELSGKNNIRPDDERYDQVDAVGELGSASSQAAAVSAVAEEVEVKTSASKEKSGGSANLLAILFLAGLVLIRRIGYFKLARAL